jgi:hypothetical protein
MDFKELWISCQLIRLQTWADDIAAPISFLINKTSKLNSAHKNEIYWRLRTKFSTSLVTLGKSLHFDYLILWIMRHKAKILCTVSECICKSKQKIPRSHTGGKARCFLFIGLWDRPLAFCRFPKRKNFRNLNFWKPFPVNQKKTTCGLLWTRLLQCSQRQNYLTYVVHNHSN